MIMMMINTALYTFQNSRDLFHLVFSAPQHFQNTGRNPINDCWMIELNGKLSWWQIMMWSSLVDLLPKCLITAPSFPQQSFRGPVTSFNLSLIASRTNLLAYPPILSWPRVHPLHTWSGPCILSSPLWICTFWALPELQARTLESYRPGLKCWHSVLC